MEAILLPKLELPVWGEDDFYVTQVVGGGSYGRVYLAIQRETTKVFALKCIGNMTEKFRPTLENELKIHSSLDHENVVKMYGKLIREKEVCLVLDYCPEGDLSKYIGNLPETYVKNYVRDICQALKYIHDQNIVHRDIKPENVLIGLSGVAKVTDFGISQVVAFQPKKTNDCRRGIDSSLAKLI